MILSSSPMTNQNSSLLEPVADYTVNAPQNFYEDVIRGLSAPAKYLNSKYFYDASGDRIFQQIMRSTEYYPTSCELEIFSGQTDQLVAAISRHMPNFDLVELGAGDALKSSYLLAALLQKSIDFTYLPIDISENVIASLTHTLPRQLPGIAMHGLNGEYFEMLKYSNTLSARNKLVLFLGSNIGNMFPADAERFCYKLRALLSPGDLLLIGFDLKKNPQVILNAYNDRDGFTRQFNLNLLARINRELDATFDLSKFEHYPTYDPENGACKSYLISTEDQQITIRDMMVNFAANEHIFMEVSQKYTTQQTDELALKTGFKPLAHFFDTRRWFADVLWEC